MAQRTVELGQLFLLLIAALGNGSMAREVDHVTDRGVSVRNFTGFHQSRPLWLMSRCAPAALCPICCGKLRNILGGKVNTRVNR